MSTPGISRGGDRLRRIPLLYFLAATTWILTSDYLLYLFPGAVQWGGTAKGLLFVTVTSALLHVLIRAASDREIAQAERARAVFAAAADAIMVLGDDGAVREWNDAAARMFGLRPEDSGVRKVSTLFPAGVPERWAEVREALEGERELEMLRPDGSPFPASWRLRSSEIARDVLVAYVHDLSRDRELERQLVQAQKMESVGRLAAGVTHDLNNLLTVVLGHVECLSDRLAPGDAGHADVEAIERTAGRAANLSRQLLAFSRQELVRREVVDLNALLRGLEPMIRGIAGAKVQVEVRPCTEGCLTVADPNRLEQVVLNLAVNARDAMPAGGRLVLAASCTELTEADVASRPGVRPGSYVTLRVEDTGTGMDEATLSRIFDPFFTTKPAGEGTGLGLSIVYGIVQQFGGAVGVSSRPGRGTEFRVHLPRASATSRVAAPAAALAAPENGRKAAILLVEDDPDLRELARRLLERNGHQVVEAGSGDEALRLLPDAGDLDLLLTDLGLPGMDGAELARQLSEIRPGIRVLVMSAYAGGPRGEAGSLPTDTMFLEKPFTGRQLLEGVRRALSAT